MLGLVCFCGITAPGSHGAWWWQWCEYVMSVWWREWGWVKRGGRFQWTSANCIGGGQLSSSSSSPPSLVWPIKSVSAKDHFISICPTATEHSDNFSLRAPWKTNWHINWGTTRRGSPARASGAGWGSCKCADSEANSLLYHSAWQYGAGVQDSDGGDHCQMSAISSIALSLLSQHAQIHTHALQHWLPLFPLASPSCLLLWPDEPSLFICYYIGIVRSKNQEGTCGVCQHCWPKVSVCCRSSPPRPILSFTRTPSADQLLF